MKPRSCRDFQFEVPDADHRYPHLVSGREPVHMCVNVPCSLFP
ncbi:MAG: hypothetical protein WCF69_07355 [Mycobacterium sp.]